MGLNNLERKSTVLKSISISKGMGAFLDELVQNSELKTSVRELIQAKDQDFKNNIWKLIQDAGDIAMLARAFPAAKAELFQLILANPERLKKVIKTSGQLVGLGKHFSAPEQTAALKNFASENGIWQSFTKDPQIEKLLSKEFSSITSNRYVASSSKAEKSVKLQEPLIETIEPLHNSPVL